MTSEKKGKNEAKLIQAAKSRGLDPKADMYKMHASFVGEYAEADARLTWRLHERFITEIEKEDLTKKKSAGDRRNLSLKRV